ncbi:hypothetical protein AVEN_222021-1 [Araneus ventricosus]|uniref:Uncharacterized protein n=1 Tax=Araneus ventricosus TaxID=182803 RepID=A0A4Y2LKR1_ARAVE|nr:hypothetical protein AVEN_222021-1 [Araneus ventricosus]
MPLCHSSKMNQIAHPDRYILVLQELSDEEKACDYINASDIIDKEHIEENYLSYSENEVNDLQDIEDLSDDNDYNCFMKTISQTKLQISRKIKEVSGIHKCRGNNSAEK